jgi:hypothetical protein
MKHTLGHVLLTTILSNPAFSVGDISLIQMKGSWHLHCNDVQRTSYVTLLIYHAPRSNSVASMTASISHMSEVAHVDYV